MKTIANERDGEQLGEPSPAWLETVRQQVNSLRFGTVQIVVHEAQVVQIERTEKLRFDQTRAETHLRPPHSGRHDSNPNGH